MWRPNRLWPSWFSPSLARRLPPPGASVDQLIGRQGQDLVERIAERHVREERDRLLEAAAVERLGADLALDPLHLALERFAEQGGRRLAAVVELGLEMQPLPDLSARDLRRRRVLHEVVDRDGAAAPKPRLDILHADPDILAQALFRALASVNLEQVLLRHVDIVALL